MPPGKIWNVEWLNQNSQRNYPISEGASRKDTTGTFELPLDLVVDLVWPVHASADIQTDRFYIHSLTVFGESITITLGYHIVGQPEGNPIGSVSVAQATHQVNQSYFISGIGDFFDSVGKITIGKLENTLSSGGLYSFDLDGARLEPTVIRPNLRGVSGVILVNGDDQSDTLFGDIEFVAGTNVRLVPNPNPSGNPQIRIDAIRGAGLNQECDCTDQLPEDAPCIRTINGIPPDDSGNFFLEGDDCFQLESTDHGLKVKDECSEACCGCEELEKILQDLEQLTVQISTLDNLTNRLDSTVNTAMVNLIASKSGELPCDET